MTSPRASIASTLALFAWCTASVLAFAYLTGAWPAPDSSEVRFIGFHEPEDLDGRRVSWTRAYSKIDMPDPGWRPLRLSLDLRAPAGAESSPVVEIGLLDSVRTRRTIGGNWHTESLVIRDAPSGRRLEVQVWSTVQAGTGYGVGVGDVRQRAVIVSRRGVALIGVACLAAFVVWVATGRSRRATTRAVVRTVGPFIPGLIPGVAFVLVGFVPMLWLGFPGRHVWWLWASFLTLAACGRLLRVAGLRRSSDDGFPLFRDPVFELAVGLSGAVTMLYVVSFVVKRVARYTAPLEGLFPVLFAATLLIVWVALTRSRRPLADAPTWSRAERVRLAAFFLFVCVIAGPHLTAIHAYSSDPLQHVGWTNQVRLHGFVPDDYADTRLLISYPMGFASYAFVVMGITPLAPGNGVNILPVLASAIFLYTLVFGIRALQEGPRSNRPSLRDASDFLFYAAIATIFSSAQFGMWHYFEGTGRSAAALIHLIPVALLMAGLWRLQFGSPQPDRPAPRVAALLLSGVLILTINPGQLLVHGVASAAVLVVEAWSLARHRSSLGNALLGLAAALVVGLAALIADPYWYRAIARGVGRTVSDAHIHKIDADFLQRFREPACLSIGCVTDAIGRVNKLGSLVQPVTTALMTPMALVRGGGDVPGRPNAVDVAFSFPPPIHGMGVVLQSAALVFFLLTVFRQRWSVLTLVIVLLLAAGVDLMVRHVLGLLIGPGDPVLRLLPPYTTRAASVFFNQTIWAGLAAGVYFALIRSASASRTWAPVLLVWLGIVGFVWWTASTDLRAEAVRVQPTPAVPTIDDLRDFRALERAIPRGESYLVTARVLFGNNERYVDPIDEAVTLYAQADRPALFQFFQSYGAQYTATDYLNVCESLKEGVRYPSPIARSRARWVVMLSSSLLDPPIRQKWFCEMAVPVLFPTYETVARRGRLTLYRLW